MSRPRPRPRFGPDGIGEGLRRGGGTSRLAHYLPFYEAIAMDLKAGRRSLPGVDGPALAQAMLAHLDGVRGSAEYIREGCEEWAEGGLSDRRVRKRRLAELPEILIDLVSDAYAIGIELGFGGARVAAEELRPLWEQQLNRSRTGGRCRALEKRLDERGLPLADWRQVQEELETGYERDPGGFRVGDTREKIARRLGCSPRTVFNHTTNPKSGRRKTGR